MLLGRRAPDDRDRHVVAVVVSTLPERFMFWLVGQHFRIQPWED
jgi:hypothetical protein